MRRVLLAAALVAPPPIVDLPAQATTAIRAPVETIAAAGDVNGDGAGDIVMGAPNEGARVDGPTPGAAYVVFGGPSLPRLVTVNGGGPGVLHIRGADTELSDREPDLGEHVAPAGDVNGDGLADVAIAAPDEEAFFRPAAKGRRYRTQVVGVTYVVFGRREGGTLDLGKLTPTDGFAIRGAGDHVANVGDVNGDGAADLAVSSSLCEARAGRGCVHVVFGGRTGEIADVERPSDRVWTIEGSPGDLSLGASLAGAGDVNGDGLADIAIGAPTSLGRPLRDTDREPVGPGAAYVVFGRRTNARLRLDALGEGGITVRPRSFAFAGTSVAGPGDLDGDGRADVAVGAPLLGLAPREFDTGPGGVALVAGGPARRTFDDLPMLVRGGGPRAGAGLALAGAGDVDGDGRGDLLAAEGDAFRRPEEAPPAVTRLLLSGGGQTVFTGRPGAPVPSDAGDVTGDGRPDLLFATRTPCGSPAVVLDLAAGPAPPPGAGPDRLTGTPGQDELYGGEGDDVLDGGASVDCVYGDAGADALAGGGGADQVFGGPGGDRLDLGAGSDRGQGGDGADRIDGRDGIDNLVGGAGDDRLDGGSNRGQQLLGADQDGQEQIEGGAGDDTLLGGDGADALEGQAGDDTLRGGAGRDFLSGGGGANRLEGGSGDDWINARNRRRDVVDCGPGRGDRLYSRDRQDVVRRCELRGPRR